MPRLHLANLDQKRNLTFVKADFLRFESQISISNACNFKQAFYLLHKLYCVVLTIQKYFYKSFSFGTWLSNLHPAYVTAALNTLGYL